MKIIYKYEIKIVPRQNITMPIGYEILSIQNQNGKVNIWALVDTEKGNDYLIIECFGTGYEVYENIGIKRKYIGTVQVLMVKETEVYHFFERIN